MADPNDAYQRSIDQAAKIYANASASYNAIKDQMSALEVNPADVAAGGPKEAQYAALTKQLGEAQKRFNEAESAYQSAIELQDKAKAAAKEVYPAGQKRTRLDTTAGNVLVSIEETADGRGGWSVDPTSVKRVQVAGSQAAGTRISAPTTDKYVVTIQDDGTLKQQDNPNYQPDKNAGPSAVPTSEFIYQDGKVQPNPAYRPPNAEVNTSAEYINDPTSPGKFIKNPNYKPPTATVSTAAEFIPDPSNPGSFIKNPNYKSPDAQLTTGQKAVDTATAGTAPDLAAANLKKAQADADLAATNLADAKRKAAQAPTDQQAQQAIATAQRASDLANQQLEQQIAQAKDLNPVLIDQARATLQRTKQSIEQAQLGDLYGRQEQIRQIKSLVASGEIGPGEADGMVAALNKGTTPFAMEQQQTSNLLTQRQQDVTAAGNRFSTFGSLAGSSLGTFADMNKYAKVGSDAGAGAYASLIGTMLSLVGGPQAFQNPAPVVTSQPQAATPAVSGLINAAQQAVQPQPAPQPQSAQPITINIGPGAANNPQSPPPTSAPPYQYTPETSATSTQRNMAGLVSQAASSVPASEDDIRAAYGVGGPRMMATGGVVTRPTLAVIGEAGPEAVVPLDASRYMDSTLPLRNPYQTTLPPPPMQPLPLASAEQPMMRTLDEVLAQADARGLTGYDRDLFIFGYTHPSAGHQFVEAQ